MGDLITSLTGGKTSTEEQRRVDPTTQALNQLRLQESQRLFGGFNPADFSQPSAAFAPSQDVANLYNTGLDAYNQNQLYNIGNYYNQGMTDIGNTTGDATGQLGLARDVGLGLSGSNTQQAFDQYRAMLGQQRQALGGDVQGLRGQNADIYNNLANNLQSLGFDTTSNYINQVATPQIMQQMALQGLEGGGAPAAAIARATAEYGMPMYQQLAQLGQQYQGLQGGLSSGQQQALAAYGSQYGGNVANAMSQNLAAQNALQQQYAGSIAGLLGQRNQAVSQLGLSIPQVQGAFQTAGAQTASTLFPMADYARSLQAQDLARRQSLYGTSLTGLPYTAGGTTEQEQKKAGIFSNIFGGGTGMFGVS